MQFNEMVKDNRAAIQRLLCLALAILPFAKCVESQSSNYVPIVAAKNVPVMRECALKLHHVDSAMVDKQSRIDATNSTDALAWYFTWVCGNTDKYFACLEEAQTGGRALTRFDQVLIALMYMDGLKATYADFCSNIDYVVAHEACMNSGGSKGQIMTCVDTFAHSFHRNLPTNATVQPEEVCNAFAVNSTCLDRLEDHTCGEAFATYLLTLETRVVKKECRGGTPSPINTFELCKGPDMFLGQGVNWNGSFASRSVQQCVSENRKAAVCLMMNGYASTNPYIRVQREVFDFDKYSSNVEHTCKTFAGFPNCVQGEVVNASRSCTMKYLIPTEPESLKKDTLCRHWGLFVSCVESAVSGKCDPTSARQWTAISLSTLQPWCRDVIAASGAASFPKAIATNIFLVTLAGVLLLLL